MSCHLTGQPPTNRPKLFSRRGISKVYKIESRHTLKESFLDVFFPRFFATHLGDDAKFQRPAVPSWQLGDYLSGRDAFVCFGSATSSVVCLPCGISVGWKLKTIVQYATVENSGNRWKWLSYVAFIQLIYMCIVCVEWVCCTSLKVVVFQTNTLRFQLSLHLIIWDHESECYIVLFF